jgi:hypothetical protein
MYGFTLVDKFRSLDIYRKLPSDFVQPTYSGALSNSNFYKNIFLMYSIYDKCNNNVLFINQ